MYDHSGVAEFDRAFCTRVKTWRVASGMTQEKMAQALGIPPKRYEKYETRSKLPHELVGRFARVTGADIGSLFEQPDEVEGSSA